MKRGTALYLVFTVSDLLLSALRGSRKFKGSEGGIEMMKHRSPGELYPQGVCCGSAFAPHVKAPFRRFGSGRIPNR